MSGVPYVLPRLLPQFEMPLQSELMLDAVHSAITVLAALLLDSLKLLGFVTSSA